jgi:hypothetical protein
MKRLFLLIWLLVIGCSNPFMSDVSEEDCECVFEITSALPSNNGIYQLEFNNNLRQTYSVLDITTECGWSQHIQWDSDYQYQIVPGQWTSLVNPASMTDEDGNAHIVFAVWEEFIDSTITIYGSYIDDHGHTKMDSVKVYVVDNE